MAETVQNRGQLRKKIHWPVSITTDHGTIEGVSLNISLVGLFVRCNDPLPVNKTFPMSIQPPKQDAIEVVGEVVWSEFYGREQDNSVYGLGICLVKVSEQDQTMLEEMIALPQHGGGDALQ